MTLESRTHSFIDYRGVVRKFTVAARVCNGCEMEKVGFKGDYMVSENEPKRLIVVGLSVCHPDDMKQFSEEIGFNLAKSRTYDLKKAFSWVLADNDKLINFYFITHILDNAAQRFRGNPALFIEGYEKASRVYYRKKKLIQSMYFLTDKEKGLLESLFEIEDFEDRFADIVKKLVARHEKMPSKITISASRGKQG